MPFTPAHAAVVLPFLKKNVKYISGTGLVMGSFAPDFEYFFKFSVESSFSHTAAGLFYFDVPVAILLSLLFHSAVKQNFITNLPYVLRNKFHLLQNLDFTTYFKANPFTVLFSALFGAASHIIWDAFTHRDGFFVLMLPFYSGTFVPYDGVMYPLWYALQHISTVVGLLAVVIYVFMKPGENVSGDRSPSWWYWLLLTLVTTLVVAIRFAIRSADYNLGNFVVTSISGFCIALVVCGLIRFKK